jgi:hypothetical protein
MTELPILGRLLIDKRVREIKLLYFAKPVKVKLSDERTEVVVFEVLRNYFRRKLFRVLYNKLGSIIRPNTTKDENASAMSKSVKQHESAKTAAKGSVRQRCEQMGLISKHLTAYSDVSIRFNNHVVTVL